MTNPWVYLILWARGPAGWFPFDETAPKRMSSTETAQAVWALRAQWNNYTDPVGIYRYGGDGWKLASFQNAPLKKIASQ